MTWLPVTLLAGLFQAWRTAVQARVSQAMSLNAAGLVRYLFGLPVAMLLLVAVAMSGKVALPDLSLQFFLFSGLAGLAQIIGTNLLLLAFRFRNFVAGTAYAKTEAIQGALVSFIVLGERLSLLTILGIMMGVTGVITISTAGARPRLRDIWQSAALSGLGAGFAFTVTSVLVKVATFEIGLPQTDRIYAAMITLVVVLSCQTLMQGGFVIWREREQLAGIVDNWCSASQVGLLSSLGSACWFTGFALAPVALVRAVGQVEVVFTLGFSYFYLSERLSRSELVGLLVVDIGVVLAIVGAPK